MNESDIQRSDTTTSSTSVPRGQDLRNVTDQEVTSWLLRDINVKNCSLSTTYNGEVTHRKQQK